MSSGKQRFFNGSLGRRDFLQLSTAAGAALALPSLKMAKADTPRTLAVVLGAEGRGDLGWNDLAWHGGEWAKTDGIVDEFQLFTSGDAEALSLFRDLASSGEYGLIVSASSAFGGVMPAVANEYPDQNYAQLDFRPDLKAGDPGNDAVLGLVFRQDQVSAQAGVLAALMAAQHDFERAGLVLGEEIAVLYDFEMGFKWGVDWGLKWLAANQPDVLAGKKIAALDVKERVLWTYTGVWGDPAKGKAATEIQIQQGAGIIYQAAGGTGLGVLEAVDGAHKAGNIEIGKPPFAIGVDADQDWINPHILASAMKRVDLAVYNATKLAMEGTFRDAVAKDAGYMWMTLANGGVALSDESTLDVSLDFAKTAGSLTDEQIPVIKENYKTLRSAQPAWVWGALAQLGTDINAGAAEVPAPTLDPVKFDIQKLREIYG